VSGAGGAALDGPPSGGAAAAVHAFDVTRPDGRTVRAYDAGGDGAVVLWQHGTPNVGAPPQPLLAPAAELGLRWVSLDRGGYGGSSPHPGRSIADAAADALAVLDALGVDRFAVMGYSGGGPHALACAALAPARVTAVAAVSPLAPIDAAGLDWFAGMGPTSRGALRAALAGVDDRRRFEAENADAPLDFTATDWSALTGPWGWLGTVAAEGLAAGVDGLIDDDRAYVTPWEVDLSAVSAPVLVVHAEDDRVVPVAHARWLAEHLPTAELRALPGAGHIAAIADERRGALDALRWLAQRLP